MSIRKGIDTNRLSKAVERPGIDPRQWIVKAKVEDIAVDPEYGVFADCRLVDDGTQITALVGSPYAEDGGGFHLPFSVGDTVWVCIPRGEPDAGPVVFCRHWDTRRKPPPDFAANAQLDPSPDIILRAKKGRRFRIATTDADVTIEADGTGGLTLTAGGTGPVTVTGQTVKVVSPNVMLGDAPGAQVARVGDMVVVSVPPLATATGPVSPVNPLQAVPTPAPGIVGIKALGQIVSGSSSVKA